MNWLSGIADIVTIAALIVTLYQLFKMKKINIATRDAILSTRKEIERSHTIHDIAKYNESIKLIQKDIQQDRWDFALLRMQELRATLIELNEIPYLKEASELTSFHNSKMQLGIDINNINKHLLTNSKGKLSPEKISNNLEELSAMLITIKSKIIYYTDERKDLS